MQEQISPAGGCHRLQNCIKIVLVQVEFDVRSQQEMVLYEKMIFLIDMCDSVVIL